MSFTTVEVVVRTYKVAIAHKENFRSQKNLYEPLPTAEVLKVTSAAEKLFSLEILAENWSKSTESCLSLAPLQLPERHP